MSEVQEVYPVEVAGVKRDLTLFEVAPGVRIAILNILGDTELVQAASRELAARLGQFKGQDGVVLVTAEAKSIPLICAMAMDMDLPYVVLRKVYKPYMGEALAAETLSITTGKPQTLYLDQKDHSLVGGKSVILVDDVISTGSTLQGMRLLMEKADASVVEQAAIFTEGDRADWQEIVALGHLPVFIDGDE